MANKLDTYYNQLVLESDLDTIQSNFEVADRKLMTDQEYSGVMYGLEVQQNGTPNLTVNITGPGTAYDTEGRRVAIPSTVNLDMSVDRNAVSTAVVTPGNSKILSIFLKFDVALSDQRLDGNGVPVYYNVAESYALEVVQGAEGASPSPPALEPGSILLADVTLTHSQTSIVTGNISTARRQWVFNLTATSPAQYTGGRIKEAMQALLTSLNSHIIDVANPHPASAIVFTPFGSIASTDVQGALEELDGGSTGLSGHLSSSTAHQALNIASFATGDVTSTNVQSAIAELDSEKAALTGATFTGNTAVLGGTWRHRTHSGTSNENSSQYARSTFSVLITGTGNKKVADSFLSIANNGQAYLVKYHVVAIKTTDFSRHVLQQATVLAHRNSGVVTVDVNDGVNGANTHRIDNTSADVGTIFVADDGNDLDLWVALSVNSTYQVSGWIEWMLVTGF